MFPACVRSVCPKRLGGFVGNFATMLDLAQKRAINTSRPAPVNWNTFNTGLAGDQDGVGSGPIPVKLRTRVLWRRRQLLGRFAPALLQGAEHQRLRQLRRHHRVVEIWSESLSYPGSLTHDPDGVVVRADDLDGCKRPCTSPIIG